MAPPGRGRRALGAPWRNVGQLHGNQDTQTLNEDSRPKLSDGRSDGGWHGGRFAESALSGRPA